MGRHPSEDDDLLVCAEVNSEDQMEFQQLEMFAAVLEEGSISRAAQRVCRTGPAVSIALKKLEAEMGTPLFERNDRHSHQLTASGKLLYEHAKRILDLRREAETAVKHSSHDATLRIGTHESTSLYLLPSLMARLNKTHPRIKTEVICGNADRLLLALANRAIELALIGEAPAETELDGYILKRDELVVIAKPDHRLSNRQHISVEDLRDEYLIVQGSKSLLRERIVQAMRASGIPFNIGVENVGIEAIKRMVINGLGIGFIPTMCVSEEVANGKLVALKVDDLRTDWNISLVWRKDHSLSRIAREFVELIIKSPRVRQVKGRGQHRQDDSQQVAR
jgi:DNA-binding transcriptional LysR family regulator